MTNDMSIKAVLKRVETGTSDVADADKLRESLKLFLIVEAIISSEFYDEEKNNDSI